MPKIGITNLTIIANASTTLTIIYWHFPLWHIFQNREINFLFSERREKFIASSERAHRGISRKVFLTRLNVCGRARTNPWFTLRASGSESERPPAAENSPGPQVHTAPPRRLTLRQQHSRAHNAPAPVCALALACSLEAQSDNNRDWE